MYRWVARYYDEFFGGFRVPIDAARNEVLRGILPGVRSACDLACGSGATAVTMARAGIQTFAVDESPLMCRLTRERAREAAVKVKVICGDMREFTLPQQVDLVTCEGDAINHVADPADLAKVAAAVARALVPGGHFYFDVNTAVGFQRYWHGTVYFEKPGVTMAMHNSHVPGGYRAASEIELFVQHGRTLRRHQERVEEVCWKATEIRRYLTEAGFEKIRAVDAAAYFGGTPGNVVTRGCRSIYVARKAAG